MEALSVGWGTARHGSLNKRIRWHPSLNQRREIHWGDSCALRTAVLLSATTDDTPVSSQRTALCKKTGLSVAGCNLKQNRAVASKPSPTTPFE